MCAQDHDWPAAIDFSKKFQKVLTIFNIGGIMIIEIKKGENKMKVLLSRASNWDFKKEIEISTLGELFRLIDKYGCDLILGKEYYPTGDIFENHGYEEKGTIIIYDDYVE